MLCGRCPGNRRVPDWEAGSGGSSDEDDHIDLFDCLCEDEGRAGWTGGGICSRKLEASRDVDGPIEDDRDCLREGALFHEKHARALGRVHGPALDGFDAGDQVAYVLLHRFPCVKSPATLEQIRASVRQDMLCSTLSAEVVQMIVDAMEFCRFGVGEVIVRQGEPGCFFFTTHEGELDIVIDGDHVNTVSAGHAFGSLALLYNCPRNATVKARSPAGLWVCDGRAFRKVVRASAQQFYCEHRSFMDAVAMFEGLAVHQKDRLSEAFLAEVHRSGTEVLRRGQAARSMYIVKRGRLQGIAGGQVVQQLNSGDCFGERALLYDEPRLASIRTVTHCELLSVTYGQLQAVLGQDLSPQRLKRNMLLKGLRNSPVFAKFPVAHQLALVDRMSVVSHSPRALIELSEFGIVVDGDALVPRLAGMGTGLLRRGQWFGDPALVEVFPRRTQEEYALSRGPLLQEMLSNTLADRPVHRGWSTTELGSLTAGDKGCSIAVLRAGDVAQCLRDLGIAGIGTSVTALKYAQKMQAVSEVYLFQSLSHMQMDKLVGILFAHDYARGALVARQGEVGRDLHIVSSGELGVYVNGAKTRTLLKGMYFGERALLVDENQPATVCVESDCAEVWSIDQQAFRQIVNGRLKEQLFHRVILHSNMVSLKELWQEREIGRGSFGIVRRVRHVHTRVAYALKRVRKASGILPQEVKDECALLASLDHPLVAYLVAIIEKPKYVYLVMEFLPGGDLFSTLGKLGWVLRADQVRFYGGCVVLALEALCARGIVYRDLKPQSIMLDWQGYIKLLDFGAAKQLHGGRAFTGIGTPWYTAPEVLEGRGYGAEADLWSFGVLLFEMFFGRFPFGEGLRDCKSVYLEVLKAPLLFPARFRDRAAKELIRGLLTRPSEERLGSGLRGWEEVREADFFSGGSPGSLLFDQLKSRECTPPLVPDIEAEVTAGHLHEDLLSDAHEFAH